MTIFVFIIIALQILDAATTIYALSKPGLVEGNPIMAKWFSLVGLIPGLIIIKGAFILLIWWQAPQIPVEILYLVIAGYLWVIWNNVTLLMKK